MCTNTVASHLIQECLGLLTAKDKLEQLAQMHDNLKGIRKEVQRPRVTNFFVHNLIHIQNLYRNKVVFFYWPQIGVVVL